jgi:DNA polymerase-3 subunit epsilon
MTNRVSLGLAIDQPSTKLSWLGGFTTATARSDALATVFLMTLSLPTSGKTGFMALLDCARRPLRAVRAEETAFEQRASLKARGYRWDDGDGRRKKAWWILTDHPQAEIVWLEAEIYREKRDITVLNMPATMRYSARLWGR